MKLTEWAEGLEMPMGIGVDIVEIKSVQEMDVRTGGAFVRRTFSVREQAEAASARDYWSYLAGRFAVKEAVFKALAPLTPDKKWDLRIVETLRQPDGSPQVQDGDLLREVMKSARVSKILVSITNESGFACAFVVAVRV